MTTAVKDAADGVTKLFTNSEYMVLRQGKYVYAFFGLVQLAIFSLAIGYFVTTPVTNYMSTGVDKTTAKYQYVINSGTYPVNNTFNATARTSLIVTTTSNYTTLDYWIPGLIMGILGTLIYLASYVIWTAYERPNAEHDHADPTVFTSLAALHVISWSVQISALLYFFGEKGYILSVLSIAAPIGLAGCILLCDMIQAGMVKALTDGLKVKTQMIQWAALWFCLIEGGVFGVLVLYVSLVVPMKQSVDAGAVRSGALVAVYSTLLIDVTLGLLNLVFSFVRVWWFDMQAYEIVSDFEGGKTSNEVRNLRSKGSTTVAQLIQLSHVFGHLSVNVSMIVFVGVGMTYYNNYELL